MPGFLHTSSPTTFGPAGDRNYDYTKIYSPDKQGDEAKENARVWNVYLDEAENYDAGMIQGFRNIIDGLLVFAALFSAVVTTFVAQTSQALQSDNTQIIASLLFENNQLLRAAGNRTSINAVSTAALRPGSQTYTSIDVWVNGLFFASLALSLSTALLTVLAKQWIQAYTAIVPGGAKTRALIRHFRFQGLMKWKLSDIIESLPLILHTSVAIFLVGLALYVSQLSSPICGVVSAITALTLLFYFGTTLIPAFDIACPYRILFMFSLAQPLMFAFRAMIYVSLCLWHMLTGNSRRMPRPQMSRKSLKMAEHNEVFGNIFPLLSTDSLAYDSLSWIFNHSSNHSVKVVVAEGTCGLLDEWSSSPNIIRDFDHLKILISISEHSNLLLSTIIYSLSQLPDMISTFTAEDEVEQSTCGRLIGNLMKISSSKSLLDEPLLDLKDWREFNIEDALINAYQMAVNRRCHSLSKRLLDWGNLLQSGCGREVLFHCLRKGDAEDIRDLVDRLVDQGTDSLTESWHGASPNGWITLNVAASFGSLDGVVALVERKPALISEAQVNDPLSPSKSYTALDLAIQSGNFDIAAYLLDRGVNPSSDALHVAVQSYSPEGGLDKCLAIVEFLLDHGWDRTTEDAYGKTPTDIARKRGYDAIVEHLERYQTARLPISDCVTHSE